MTCADLRMRSVMLGRWSARPKAALMERDWAWPFSIQTHFQNTLIVDLQYFENPQKRKPLHKTHEANQDKINNAREG